MAVSSFAVSSRCNILNISKLEEMRIIVGKKRGINTIITEMKELYIETELMAH